MTIPTTTERIGMCQACRAAAKAAGITLSPWRLQGAHKNFAEALGPAGVEGVAYPGGAWGLYQDRQLLAEGTVTA